MTATETSAEVQAAVDTYVWGYPLVVMHRTRRLTCSRTPSGTMNHVSSLATPRSRAVVAPNNDTLYSTGWFDLSAGDLEIDVPPMDHPDRYWSVMLIDAFTNVGYICRRLHGTEGVKAVVTYDRTTASAPDGSTTIRVGTPTVWVLARVLVDGEDDLDAARAVQQAIRVTPPPGHPSTLTEPIGRPNAVHEAGAAFFDELRGALAIDPPANWHPQLSAASAALVAGDCGVSPEDLASAVTLGEQQVARTGFGSDRRANGWGTRSNGTKFGDNVLLRAGTAKYALAGHHPEENRSYVAETDSTGAPLDGATPLLLRFPADGLPPSRAFWSLTVYGPDMFFVENEIDRWSLGDRTPGLVWGSDGSLEVVVGGPRPADDRNWLPAPAGPYRLGLRVYEGDDSVVGASWFPPPLVRK